MTETKVIDFFLAIAHHLWKYQLFSYHDYDVGWYDWFPFYPFNDTLKVVSLGD